LAKKKWRTVRIEAAIIPIPEKKLKNRGQRVPSRVNDCAILSSFNSFYQSCQLKVSIFRRRIKDYSFSKRDRF
jgi:hypothetical protein